MTKKFNLPQAVSPTVWEEWEEYRSSSAKLRKGWGDLARKKSANVLARYPIDEQQRMVDNSIISGWTGLFEPKQNKPAMSSSHRQFSSNDDLCKTPDEDKRRGEEQLRRMEEMMQKRARK